MDIATIIGVITAITLIMMTAEFDMTVWGNVPSYFTVIGGSIGMMLISFPLPDILRIPRCYGYVIKPPKADADRVEVINDLEKGILMLSRFKTYFLATGWIGVLIGAVLMLRSMDDPAAIGPAMSLSLLTALYGTILAYVFCVAPCTKLQVRLDEWKKVTSTN